MSRKTIYGYAWGDDEEMSLVFITCKRCFTDQFAKYAKGDSSAQWALDGYPNGFHVMVHGDYRPALGDTYMIYIVSEEPCRHH